MPANKQAQKQVSRIITCVDGNGKDLWKLVDYRPPRYRVVQKKRNPEDASFGVRVAVAALVVGACAGYVLKAIGLALA